MEGLQKAYRALSENPKPSSSYFPSFSSSTERGAATLSADQSRILVARSARYFSSHILRPVLLTDRNSSLQTRGVNCFHSVFAAIYMHMTG